MPDELTYARCTNCDTKLRIRTTKESITCPKCNASINTKNAMFYGKYPKLDNYGKYGLFNYLFHKYKDDEDISAFAIDGLMTLANNGFHEADLALGQYFQFEEFGKEQLAMHYFKEAATHNITEGMWNYAIAMLHGPDSKEKTTEIVGMMEKAAVNENQYACNELGNICYDFEHYLEASYWYNMAIVYGFDKAQEQYNKAIFSWETEGKILPTSCATKTFDKEKEIVKKFLCGEYNSLDQLMELVLAGDKYVGYAMAQGYEMRGVYQDAYRIYNALSWENYPHAMRCQANLCMVGRGTAKSTANAMNLFKMSAEKENMYSAFVYAQNFEANGEIYKAAYWYAFSYNRGYEIALNKLLDLNFIKKPLTFL